MHHAQRSIRISRPGVRTNATAAKPKAPGKWAAPSQPTSNAAPSNSAPQPNYSKWGLNNPPSASPSSSTSPPPNPLGKWARPQSSGSRPQDSAQNPFSLMRDSPPTSFRREPPPRTNHSSQRDRRSAASQQEDGGTSRRHRNGSSTSTARSVYPKPPDATEGEKVAPVSSLSASHEIHAAELEDLALPQTEVDNAAHVSEHDARTSNNKWMRVAYKDRGSLVARLRQDNDLTIPSRSRGKDSSANSQKTKAKKKKAQEMKRVNAKIYIPSVISVSNLARLLKVKLDTLQWKMSAAGMKEQSSHDYMLSSDYSSLLVMEFGRESVVNDEAAFDIHPPVPPTDKSSLPFRPPVVTIMGHVDHGKTTLLDTLRSTSVAKGEAGGITQHIGAFSVPVPSPSGDEKRTITFLDTPGHAAFSAMRARGASVTDIVVLVVAADDGIMPQTKEVIDLVQKEQDNIGLVVAINKIDKPDVDIDSVEKMLLSENVQLERFGGDVPCVHVSGLTGKGLDSLIETLNAVAEMQDLRAEQKDVIHGYVLESKMQKGLGPVATVLLLQGTLKPGMHLICGTAHAKVRSLTSPSGESVKSVLPGFAAVVSGWKELPNAGDEVLSGSESDIKRALVNRIRKAEIEASMEDMEAINISRKEERERREVEEAAEKSKDRLRASGIKIEEVEEDEGRKLLNIVVKADVSGSSEAVAQALQGIGNDIAGTRIIATGVGDVTESDIMRAKAAEGMVVAFGVKVPRAMESLAAGQSVPIVTSTIIYRLLDSVKEHVIKLLPVTYEKKVTGEATVLQVFEITGKNKQTVKVAGCRVTDGLVEKGKVAHVIRNGDTIYEGKLDTLKHLKDSINEASKGMECGMSLEGFDNLKQGDLIQIVKEVEKPGEL